jgi:glycosyltransferase involved in cell wall biosynthesis
MVLEEHLGHRTFAENLMVEARRRADVDPVWCPVRYETHPSLLDHVPRLSGLRGTATGRREVRSALSAHDADIWVYNTQVPAALAGNARRSPYVVITDVTPTQYDQMAEGYGHRPDRAGPFRWWKQRANVQVFKDAEWCVPWSTWVGRSLVADYGVDPGRVRVIPPGVDISRWRTDRPSEVDESFRILFVGGDFRRKGGDLLMRAFSSLSDRAELYLVTKSAVPSSDRIFVINDLEPNDPKLVDLFRSADVFVLPSRAETFGIAAVEASAAGLPVVASQVGGLADIVVDEQTGFLIPPGDGDALAVALMRLERQPTLRRRLGAAAGIRAAESFDASTNAGQLFDLIRSCVPEASAGD